MLLLFLISLICIFTFLRRLTEEERRLPAPGVGESMGDGIRNFAGRLMEDNNNYGNGLISAAYGPFWLYKENLTVAYYNQVGSTTNRNTIGFNPSRLVPTFSVNRMRTFGCLLCAYLGRPAL